LEREIDDELRFHIEQYEEDLVRSGASAPEARRRARVEFGGIESRKEEMRGALGLRLLDEVTGDLRYAFRQLRRSPAFTTVAVLSLALGIGANAAIFSLMEAALWKPIPVTNPEQLRLFSWVSGPNRVMDLVNGRMDATPGGGTTSTSFSFPVFVELQRQNQGFENVFAFKPTGSVTAVIDGYPELITGELVSGNFYEGLGVRPSVGRPIVVADDRRGAETVAVISDGFWARRFGRDPSIVGKGISVNSVPITVVGVNPSEFTGVEPGRYPEIFLPLQSQPAVRPQRGDRVSLLDRPDYWWVLVLGRLKPGVSDSQAHVVLDAVFQRVVRDTMPDRIDRDQPRLTLLSGARGWDSLERYGNPLFVLWWLVVLVLLIVCANVGNLLLARAAMRQREISLRLALGAGRWRVTRQLLTEGLALAVLGGAAGVLLGYWMRDGIPSLLATSWRPSPFQAEFNWRVVGLCVAATMATGILFSVAPAWRSARLEINTALKDAGRMVFTLPRWWRGRTLVVFQVCVAVLLLIGSGLFVRTLWNLRSSDIGFQPERVLLLTVDPPRVRYPGEQRNSFLEEIHRRISAIPGVESATLSSDLLVGGGSSRSGVDPDGKNPELRRIAWVNDVGYGFFETMGIPILYGRSFNQGDRATSQAVAIVNQQFVREFFPDENPLGRTFRNVDRVLQIVGISGDVRYDNLRRPFPPTFYRVYLQRDGDDLGPMTFEVRTAASQESVVSAIRQAVRSIDKDLPVFDIRTQNEQITATLSQERLFVALTTAFAGLALVLACIGIYGIMANGVARRTNEIGIRLALGAQRKRVLMMILREVALLAVIGSAIGVAAAAGLTRYIQSMLFGVQPIDPVTIVGAVLLMLLVALLAGWLPARRASRLEPMAALRHE
jgi:predicted permease